MAIIVVDCCELLGTSRLPTASCHFIPAESILRAGQQSRDLPEKEHHPGEIASNGEAHGAL